MLVNPSDPLLRVVRKTVTFDGSAGGGAIGNVVALTITGRVLIVALSPMVMVQLVGATATLSLGITSSVARMIAASAIAGFTANTFWFATTPVAGGNNVAATMQNFATRDNVVIAVAAANVTAGAILFECYYRPLSADGALA